MSISLLLKIDLAAHCKAIIQERISIAEEAMNAAQNAANSEEKSTAGDKYDTARAMNQRDRDMNARQLCEALNLLHLFHSIVTNLPHSVIQAGSLIKTSNAIYFISVGLGRITFQQTEFAVISTVSPIANILLRKRIGDKVSFQGTEIKVLEII